MSCLSGHVDKGMSSSEQVESVFHILWSGTAVLVTS